MNKRGRRINVMREINLRSGMSGSGGRATSSASGVPVMTDRASHHGRPQTPYRVARTVVSDYTRRVSGNTTRIYRDER